MQPYVIQPERTTVGNPRFYATTLDSEGWGLGVVVETREGRPVKIEGNPDYPASRGATDAVMQAEILSLYDPGRLRTPRSGRAPSSWEAWEATLATLREELRPSAAFLDLGRWGLAVASLIAGARTALIAGVYMEVLERGRLLRLAVVTMDFFLTVLFPDGAVRDDAPAVVTGRCRQPCRIASVSSQRTVSLPPGCRSAGRPRARRAWCRAQWRDRRRGRPARR